MVLGEHEPAVPVDLLSKLTELLRQEAAKKKLFVYPERHRLREGCETAWSEADVCLEQPLELEIRFLVKNDEVDVFDLRSRKLQAEGDSRGGKSRVMPSPAEALFLRRCDDPPVLDQRGGAVMIERGNTKDFHPVRISIGGEASLRAGSAPPDLSNTSTLWDRIRAAARPSWKCACIGPSALSRRGK